jgi:cytochrome c biogenesis protein ResB
LYDEKAGINGEDRFITMNEPLEYRGYRFYQSEYRVIGVEPETDKAIHFSGFTVGHDPGLWFKFIGTAMIGLGIATMFWMKAYINHPKVGRLFQLFSFSG